MNAPARTVPRVRPDLALGALALGLAAWAAGRQFAVEWEVNPQYAYGWSVPFLAALLLWRRWQQRPEPEPVDAGARTLAWGTVGLIALAWLPARVVQEANPDWRPWGWAMALGAVGLAFAGAFLLGGPRWRRWFAFPLAFGLVAAPWPERLENSIVQGLMQGVSAAAVEFLDLLGWPALRRGNLIEVGGGLIGVEEACSGIRSLQATLMAGLFLGEYYRLRGAKRRGGLLLAGAGLALATNLLRTFFLVWISVREGPAAFARWHDRAGLIVLVTCLLGLWALAVRWAAPEGEPAARRAVTAVPLPRLPLGAIAAVTLGMVGAEGLTPLWYHWRGESRAGTPRTWTARPPENAPTRRALEIPEASRALLRYTEGEATAWLNPGATERWTLFFARWAPGRGAAASAGMHTPGVCMTAAGKTLLGELGIVPVRCADERGGFTLPMRGYRFEANGRELWVFHCVWEDRPEAGSADEPSERALRAGGRFSAAWAGRRNLGQRVLEVTLLGPGNEEAARERLQAEVPLMVFPVNPAPAAPGNVARIAR